MFRKVIHFFTLTKYPLEGGKTYGKGETPWGSRVGKTC
jgi:hypothetical protein